MKKFEKYSNWIFILILFIIAITVYKTFDNFYIITDCIAFLIDILSPFIIGFFIAYILNIPCKKISCSCEKSKYKFIRDKRKPISILSVYLIAVIIFIVVVRTVVPAIYNNLLDLYYNIPKYAEELLMKFSKWQDDNGVILFELNEANVKSAISKILEAIDIKEFSKYAKGVISITSGVLDFFIGIIVSVYMLIDKEKIKASIKRVMYLFINKTMCDKIISVVKRTNDVFSKYFFCLLIDAAVMTVLFTVVLSILKVKYAIILGCMIGIFNLIPYFGAIFAVAITIVITLITGGLLKAVWTFIILLVLQQVDGNFIGPKIMGEMLDASPLLIIFAITLGGGIFGIGGMIVSVPLFIVLKMIITDFLKEKELKTSGK